MNPFARRTPEIQNGFGTVPYGYSQPVAPVNSIDPVDYTTDMIRRSGGDAKAAFYSACEEKGVNADDFIRKVQTIQNPRMAVQNMMMSNPKVRSLFSLFSSVK